jgi:hypothetical protein
VFRVRIPSDAPPVAPFAAGSQDFLGPTEVTHPRSAVVARMHVTAIPARTEKRLTQRSQRLTANDVDLVKRIATAFARLRVGDISRVRLVGLDAAGPERRALVVNLLEDSRAVVGSDVAVLGLPLGDGFELVSAAGRGESVEIDVLDVVREDLAAPTVSLRIGDRVRFRGHGFIVRGISPMGAAHRRVHLEDTETAEQVEASLDDVQPE